MTSTQMQDGIEKFSGILSKKTCELLIKHIEVNIDSALDCQYSSNNYVKCHSLYLTEGSDLDKLVFKGIAKVLEKFTKLYPYFHARNDTGYQLRKIYDETRIHVDQVASQYVSHRNCSIILGLNNDYENGKFHFPNQQYTTKLGLGEAIIFPVYFMYPHFVEKPKGFRYTINTWTKEE